PPRSPRPGEAGKPRPCPSGSTSSQSQEVAVQRSWRFTPARPVVSVRDAHGGSTCPRHLRRYRPNGCGVLRQLLPLLRARPQRVLPGPRGKLPRAGARGEISTRGGGELQLQGRSALRRLASDSHRTERASPRLADLRVRASTPK